MIIAILLVINISLFAQDSHNLYDVWQNPPLDYRLNKNIHYLPLDIDRQKSQIDNTLAGGWGGFALNVSFRQYLTDKGMISAKQFCENAKAKGMDLWLYDEQGYPSGSAGGRVLKQNPALESKGIFFTDSVVSGGNNLFKIPPGEPILVLAFPIENGKADYSRPVNLMNQLNGSQIHWNAPKGKWTIFASTINSLYEGFQADRNPYPYPSLLLPETADTFINITHEKYAEYFGSNLGRYFTSTFTDEPSTMAMQFHRYNEKHAVIPWHEGLSNEFARRYGYRPETRLVELFYDDGPAGQQVRYQYFKTVGDMISTNYFGRLRQWCEKHSFRSGGHLLLEETMAAHVPLYGNIMQCFRQMNAPGVDILSCYPENMPIHSPKLASSAAELSGHDRVMSEPCPVTDGDSEPPLESIRGFFNMLLLSGVTDFNCYLKLNKLSQQEQIDLNKYVGRIGMLLRGGYTAADIGVVYPIESLWTKYTPRYHKVSGWKEVAGTTPAVKAIDRSFQDVSRFMYDNRWEYMHLDSQAIVEGIVKNGSLVHGPHHFEVIVLPTVDTLPIEAWWRLLVFARQGGKLVFLNGKPTNSDIAFPDVGVQSSFAEMANENVIYMENWNSDSLDSVISKWLSKKVHIEDEKLPLKLTHKVVGKNEVFFLINDSADTIKTSIKFDVKGLIEKWDPENGTMTEVSDEIELAVKPYYGQVFRIKAN